VGCQYSSGWLLLAGHRCVARMMTCQMAACTPRAVAQRPHCPPPSSQPPHLKPWPQLLQHVNAYPANIPGTIIVVSWDGGTPSWMEDLDHDTFNIAAVHFHASAVHAYGNSNCWPSSPTDNHTPCIPTRSIGRVCPSMLYKCSGCLCGVFAGFCVTPAGGREAAASMGLVTCAYLRCMCMVCFALDVRVAPPPASVQHLSCC
jgi:hypothetical protein